jgi:hypothetical protein
MLARIKHEIDLAARNGVTPLFVDTSEEENTLRVLRSDSQFVILDAKKIHYEYSVKKHTVEESLDQCRSLLVFAMQRGRTLVVRLQSSSVDFLSTLNDESCPEAAAKPKLSYFPLDIFRNCGQLAYTDSALCQRLHRREDRPPKGTGPCFCEPGFRLIVTTTNPPDLVNETLFNGSFGLPSRDLFEIIEL